MSERTDVRQVNVDQSLQLVADQFEIDIAGTWPFEQRADLELASIATGLLDTGGDPHLVSHITDGVIDEVDLNVTPREMTTVIRGRDASAKALQSALFIEYGGDISFTPPALPPQLADIPGVTTVIRMPGKFRASEIATDLCNRIGLTCTWQIPDYDVKGVFSVSGPIINALQDLASPFAQFEPSRADIWCEGQTLIIRGRPGLAESPAPGTPTPHVFSIQTLRGSTINVRSSWLEATRILRLTGAGQGGGTCLSFEDESTEQLIFDKTGKILTTRIVERTTRRKPDNAVLKVVKETYTQTPGAPGQATLGTLQLSQRSTQICDWDDLFMDADCNQLNTPLEHRQTITIEAIDPDSTVSALFPLEEHKVAFQYDEAGFRTTQQTDVFKYDKDTRDFEAASREIIRLAPKGILEFEQITDRYVAGENDSWALQSSSRAPAGGHLPGGPGRALPKNVSVKNPVYVAQLVDDLPEARDFTYSNPNLNQEQLNIIRDQCIAASSALELEVTFTATAVPWLRKGQRVRVTGLKNPANGDLLTSPLDTFLVTANQIKLVETRGGGSSYMSRITAVNWSQAWRDE